MPSTDLVERLHERLIQLGNEPAVAAERGEAIEPPVRPESKIDDDLSALLGDAISEGSEDEATPEIGEEPTDPFVDVSLGDDDFPVPQDYSFDPDAIPDSVDEGEPAAPESLEEDAFASADDAGDLDDVFGGDDFDLEGIDEAIEPAEEAAPEEPAAPAEPDDQMPDLTENFDIAGTELDEFGADEFDSGELGDLSELEDLGDLEDDGDFGDLGDLSALDDLDADTPSEGEPAAPESLEEDAFAFADDAGDLGDMFGGDDLDLGGIDEAIEPAEEAAPEEAATPAEPDDQMPDLTEDFDSAGAELDEFGADEFDLGEFDVGEIDSEDFAAGQDDAIDTAEPESFDDSDFGEITDLEDEAAGLESGADAFGTGEFEDAEDVGADDGFGPDFGSQVDEEFGDINLDDDSISADPFADSSAEAFELPAVDDSIESLEDEGFSLGDFGDAFDIDEESMDDFAGLETVDADEGVEESAESPETVDLGGKSFSDEEFGRIKQTLGTLPLNVKIAVEECIGETKGSPADTLELLEMLVRGETPQKIAAQVSRATGSSVQVPKGYERRSGVAFEEEKRSFRYQFVHVILPILRLAAVLAVAASVLGISLYRFVYQPVYAGILYRRGYEDIQEERYDLAEETFSRAYDLRPRDKWFIEYAEAFVEKREYQRAVRKYDQLVFGMNDALQELIRLQIDDPELGPDKLGDIIEITDPENPGSVYRGRIYDLLNVVRPAILDHVHLQSVVLANYQRAEELLSILLFRNAYDADALLAQGDNYYRWSQIDPNRLADSYRAFENYIMAHGPTDEVMMRFLRHYIATDNHQQVHEIVFDVQSRPGSEVDARIYANAANYLLDKLMEGNPLEPHIDIRTVLVRAYDQNPLQPEVQYVDARNRHRLGDKVGERAALDEAQRLFELAEPLEPDQLAMQIDTDINSGEYYIASDEVLTADQELERARRRYDRAKEAGLLDPDPRLARVYEELGDVFYYNGGDLDDALDYYRQAVTDGRSNDQLSYKRGFIHYEREEYDEAIDLFLDAWEGNGFSGPENVLYARGNTLFRRGTYPAAEAYYRELRRRLNSRRDGIRNLMVEEKPQEQALIEMMYKVENNLGVTLYRMAAQNEPRAESLRADALYHLQISTELFENYLRDPDSGVRAEARSLAFINLRNALYPRNDNDRFETFELEIHERIPRDETQLFF